MLVGKYLVEISIGSFTDKILYGVTVIKEDGDTYIRDFDTDSCFESLEEVEEYLKTLKDGTNN